MGLLVYECGRPDFGHEIRQWTVVTQSLYDYYQGRDELVLLIINFNISDVALDGLLIKDDAVIIVELKDRSGIVTARQNGEWECDDNPLHPIIHGGSGKTVFEQLRVNRRTLLAALRNNDYLPEEKIKDIQGLVTVSRLDGLKTDFDRETMAWVHVTDVKKIARTMHDIKSRPYREPGSGNTSPVYFSQDDIFTFIRKVHLDERSLILDVSDIHLLPSDLYHPDSPHNGNTFSFGTVLANNMKQIETLSTQIDEVKHVVEALLASPDIKDNAKRYSELLEAKKNVAEKDLEGISLQIQQTSQEIQFLEAQVKREEERNTPEREFLALQENLDSKKVKVNELNEQAQVKKSELAQVTEELKEIGKAESAPNESFLPPEKEFSLGEEFLDDDQLDLIELTNDANMLVTGPAGCGKSLIAVHKANQLLNNGEDVIVIAFTKSLKAFMQDGDKNTAPMYYYWEWLKHGRPGANYIIVDEIQDFTYEEILNFVKAAKKHYFFFGDTAQSIMAMEKRKPMTIEEIAKAFNLKPLRLYSNYRLPRTIARITQDYVGVGVAKFSEKIYKNDEKTLPHIISYRSKEDKWETMLRIMQKHNFSNIGILTGDNDSILEIRDLLDNKGIKFEYKWKPNDEHRSISNLDFKTSYPKIMTYHSAKGLQFQTVIIPSYSGAEDEKSRKVLYVAMTRTFRDLYILYQYNNFAKPLSDVPKYLYVETE